MITVIQSTNAGFFANFCDVVRHIIRAEERGEKWFVNWTDDSPYYSAEHGPNVWNYYFDQPLTHGDLVDQQLRYVRGYTEIDQKGQAFRDKFNEIITKHIHLNEMMKGKVEQFAEVFEIDESTIGIHYRGTDKYAATNFGEPTSAIPIPAYRYTDRASNVRQMTSRMLRNTFVATDDQIALDIMLGEDPSINYIANITRGTPNNPVHSEFNNSTAGMKVTGFRKGMEVVLEVYLLSRCGYLIRSTSNVSSTAQFINKDLHHFNVNEVMRGDTREQEYGLTSTIITANE